MMKISKTGLELITKWEGVRLSPYKDIAGKETIGVGHLIKPGEHYTFISREQALEILSKDVEDCERALNNSFPGKLNQNQFDALISFGFNCGTGVYKNSSVSSAILNSKFEDVPAGLFMWCKAVVNGNKIPVEGLLNRREHEAQIFTGTSQQSRSMNKNEIINVQKNLAQIGLYSSKIDGIMGPGTLNGIKIYLINSKKNFPERPVETRFTENTIKLLQGYVELH